MCSAALTVGPMPTSAYSCVPRCVCKYTLVRAAHPEPDFCSDPEFFAIRTQNFPNRIQFLTFSGHSYANFCLPMCAKVRIKRLLSGLHIRKRIFAQIRNFFAFRTRNVPNRIQFLSFSGRSYAGFCILMCAKVRMHAAFRQGCTFGTEFLLRCGIFLPSGPRIFQTGSSSLPFPVAPMPASAYSCVPRCVYTVNTRLLSGLHIRNRIFAQIQNFLAIRTRNFPNQIQFLTFSGRSYSCVPRWVYTPSVRVPHPEPDFCSDPEFFCHLDPEFSEPDPVPYLFLCQLLPTHVCQGAYT